MHEPPFFTDEVSVVRDDTTRGFRGEAFPISKKLGTSQATSYDCFFIGEANLKIFFMLLLHSCFLHQHITTLIEVNRIQCFILFLLICLIQFSFLGYYIFCHQAGHTILQGVYASCFPNKNQILVHTKEFKLN